MFGVVQIMVFFCIRAKDLKVLFFDAEDGLPSLECNQNAAYKDKNGDLWFGTAGGICVIEPEGLKKAHLKEPPKTNFLGMRLFMQETKWSTFNSKIDPIIPDGIKLTHDKNHLTFDFVGVHFHNPNKVYYKHRLQGFEEKFSTPHQNTFVSYSNISPGKYSFELSSSHDLSTWSTVKIISFEILPPFWLQTWFLTLCILILLLLTYLVHLFRSFLRKKKIEAQNLSYQTRLLELEQQALNASMNRHFVFNSLNSIQYFINAEDKKSANTYLTKFAKLIRKNLDDLQNEHVPLEEEIERMKLYLSLEEMRFEGSFEYQITIDSTIDVQKIAIPTMILQPFVENSIIHGILPQQKPGKIKIKISLVGRIVLFVIEDNGIGFDTSMEQKNIQKNTHVSKGMSITRERLNVLRKVYQNEEIEVLGPIEIKNEQGETEGTRVEIKLPFINLHSN
jgi:two-component sensor histidine kinase